MPTVEVKGRSIHYLTGVNGIAPERRSIVFVHGAGGSAWDWQNQRRGLDRGVNTICLDLPGHGGSSGGGCAGIAEYSSWLLGFIESLKLSEVFIAGHSMGGAVVLEAALESPQNLAGLVLVGTGAKLRVSPAILQGLEKDAEETTEQVVRSCYAPGTSDKLIKWGIEQMLQQQPEVTLNDFKACDRFDRMDQIGRITHPSLVLCGGEDIMTPPKYSRYLAEHLQQATLKIIEGAGHMVMVEDPFKVNLALLKFLATI